MLCSGVHEIRKGTGVAGAHGEQLKKATNHLAIHSFSFFVGSLSLGEFGKTLDQAVEVLALDLQLCAASLKRFTESIFLRAKGVDGFEPIDDRW